MRSRNLLFERFEQRLFTHVEPVARPVGYTDEVALLAKDVVDLAVDMQGELPRAGHEEAHFVLGMSVFAEKLLAQCGSIRVVGQLYDAVYAVFAVSDALQARINRTRFIWALALGVTLCVVSRIPFLFEYIAEPYTYVIAGLIVGGGAGVIWDVALDKVPEVSS